MIRIEDQANKVNNENNPEDKGQVQQIEIDLNKSKSANYFQDDNLVQQIAKNEFISLINQRLKDIDSYKNNDLLNTRIHETITILGGRGSGKSSLLLSMVQYTKREYKEDIFVLKVTDPTLFENKQHILVTIIALIQSKVTNHFQCDDIDEPLRNEWRKSLLKLAEGLNLLDNIGTDPMKSDGWNDATIILEKGLNQALSGESLEDNFYKFIDKSLEVLKKKVILIAFDDIDTDFEKGEKVLETLRKYFRYPKIVTLVAGDMNLFTKIVRQKNWKQFDSLIKFDKDKTLDIKNNVDHLEDQYLLKVLPTRSRVLLEDIYTLLNNYSFVFNLKPTVEGAKKEVKKYSLQKEITSDENDLFQQLNSNYFKIQSNHIKDYNNFLQSLTQLPIRTVTQFIESFMLSQQQRDEEYFIKQILSLFSSTLSKFNIQPNTLQSNENLISTLTNILINLDQDEVISFNESYRLKPIYLNEAKRTIMFLLNIIANSNFESDRSKIFEYFVKIGLTRELILGFDYGKDDILAYKEFVGLQEQETPLKMTRRYCGFINENFTTYFHNGFIKTYKRKTGLPSELKEKPMVMRSQIENASNSLKEHFLLNVLFLEIKDKSSYYGSIFPLIAIMSEFTQDISKDRKQFIEDQLRTYSQFRTFNAYKSNDISSNDNDLDEDNDTESEKLNNDLEDLITNIDNWIENILSSKCHSLPIHILSKIWTRFYYSLESIANSTKNKSFGDYIQLCVTQFLHSWIIETMLYLNQKIALRNISTSDRFFKQNYTKFLEVPESEQNKFYHFTRFVLEFPIWEFYLTEETNKKLFPKAEEASEENNKKNNFIDTLKNIAITKK